MREGDLPLSPIPHQPQELSLSLLLKRSLAVPLETLLGIVPRDLPQALFRFLQHPLRKLMTIQSICNTAKHRIISTVQDVP
jgi:hypothetical protein